MLGRPQRQRKKNWGEMRLEEARNLPDGTIDAPCLISSYCGGCAWQDVQQSLQLEFKQRAVREAFNVVGFDALDIPMPLTAGPSLHYRNHMEFTFAARRWLTPDEIASGEEFCRDFALGLHAPGGFNQLLDVGECFLQGPTSNDALDSVRNFAVNSGRPAYNKIKQTGFWRNLIIRTGTSTDELSICVITRDRDPDMIKALYAHLMSAGLNITSLVNGVTDSVADTTEGSTYHVDFGSSHLREEVDGLKFDIAPGSFFQPNTHTAALIFQHVRRMARLSGTERVVDLFSGSGTLSLSVARDASEVHGVEYVEPAVLAATRNAGLNDITNTTFSVGDLSAGLPQLPFSPDVIITDPPRAGMSEKLVRQLRDSDARRIVSVGCNPKTQARDIFRIVHKGPFQIEEIQPIDQFPQTPHVENLVSLVRD